MPSIPRSRTGISSLREFDDRITALYSGFQSADDYYYRAAAARVLDRIAVPTLLLHACDDPFIRFLPETRAIIEANPHITLLETEHGGHCAFLATPDPANGNDGYWAEHTALRFVLSHVRRNPARCSLHIRQRQTLYPERKCTQNGSPSARLTTHAGRPRL